MFGKVKGSGFRVPPNMLGALALSHSRRDDHPSRGHWDPTGPEQFPRRGQKLSTEQTRRSQPAGHTPPGALAGRSGDGKGAPHCPRGFRPATTPPHTPPPKSSLVRETGREAAGKGGLSRAGTQAPGAGDRAHTEPPPLRAR